MLGLCRNDQTKAYPFALMPDGVVINDLIGDDLVVVLFDAASRTALAYFNQLDDEPLSFYGVESEGPLPVEFMDAETGSRWNMLGEAVAGPLAGKTFSASSRLQRHVVCLDRLLARYEGLAAG